jgi:hypothetical protein
MSRIRVNIEGLRLDGFGAAEAKTLSDALQSGLEQVLRDRTNRREWARSHRTPLVKLERMPRGSGEAGAGSLGKHLAHAIGRKLKP